MPSSRPQGRKTSTSDPSDSSRKLEKRKLRNRISQQAFRTRQNLKVQELEERLQDLARPDAARIAQLQDQNAVLRDQLLECHKKLTSFEISLQDLKSAVGQALGLSSGDRDKNNKDPHGHGQSDDRPTSSPNASTSVFEPQILVDDNMALSPQPETLPATTESVTDDGLMENMDMAHPYFSDTLPLSPTAAGDMIDWLTMSARSHDYIHQIDASDSSQQGLTQVGTANTITRDWNKHSMQPLQQQLLTPSPIGIRAYHNIMDGLPPMSRNPHAVSTTNSRFSDHIDTLEFFCLQSWSCHVGSGLLNLQIAKLVHFMLSAFVSISWPSMVGWNSHVKALGPLRDVMVWRLIKTQDAFLNIVPSYRPTKLQMSVQYPSIIDWTPWPSLRDKLIIHHSANPRLDDLICEIGNSYVVPADLSKLVVCPQPVLGYVNVWDIVRAIDNSACVPLSRKPSRSSGGATAVGKQWLDGFNAFQNIVNGVDPDDVAIASQLPASDAKTLFSSRSLAVQAFKLLGMDRGAFCFCLDPKFFEDHPELYSREENLTAHGVALRADTQDIFPAPQELDPMVVKRYEELSKHALDAVNAFVLAGV